MKKATVFVLDVNPTMHNSSSSLAKSTGIVSSMLNSKLISAKKTDLVSTILMGTDSTDNALNDQFGDDQYQHLTTHTHFSMPDLELLRFLSEPDNLASESASDVLDAIILSLDETAKFCKKLKYTKKIILFTDARSPMDLEGINDVVKQLQTIECTLDVILFDHDTGEQEEFEAIQSLDELEGIEDKRELNVKTLVYLSTQSGGKTYSGDDVARITSHLRKVSVNPTTTFRGPITMGDPEKYPDEAIKFEIFLYNKTTEMKPPSAKKLSAISYDEDADGDSGKVDLVKSYKLVNPTEVDGEQEDVEVDSKELIKAYRYGKTLVPFSLDDEEAMAYRAEKGMSIVGFFKAKKLERWWFMSNVVALVPAPDDDHSATHYATLYRALILSKKVALVRYVRTAGQAVKIGAIVPNEDGVLYFSQLPYAEDYRPFEFEPIDHLTLPSTTKKSKLDTRQLPSQGCETVMKGFIESMNLNGIIRDNSGEMKDAYNPEDTFNPVYHRLYQCIAHRAIHGNAKDFPDMDPFILAGISPLQEVVDNSITFAEKLKNAFKLTNLAPTTTKRKLGDVNKNAGDDGSVDVEGILDDLSSKKAKMDETTSFSSIVKPVNEHIGTLDPISDFQHLIKQNPTQAITELVQLIQEFIFSGNGSVWYGKALDCMQTFREYCVRTGKYEGEFNDFMKGLKEKCVVDDGMEFWREIVCKEKVTLIGDDTGEFLKVEEKKETGGVGDDEGDVFDLLEDL